MNPKDNTPNRPIPGQRQPLDSPAPDQAEATRPTTPDRLRRLWHAAWNDGGPLHRLWEDIRQTRTTEWHETATWIKTLALLAGASLIVLLLDAALAVLAHALHEALTAAPRVQVGTDTTNGVWAVIDHPVRHYIAAHATGLPVTASTLYTLWLTTGAAGLIGGTLRLTGARLTWCAHGTATAAMVWNAAPEPGRALALGVTALTWALASTFALRGMSLRPTVFTHVHNAPEIHLPTPADTTAASEKRRRTANPLR